MKKANDVSPKVMLDHITRECMDKAGGDPRKAAKLVRKEVDKNPDVRDFLVDKLIDEAIWQQVTRVMRQIRSTYFRTAHEKSVARSDKRRAPVSGITSVSEHNWFDYRLATGLKLGDATKEEVIRQIDLHTANATGNARRAAFLSMVAERLTDDRKVRHVLTNEEIQQMADNIGLNE